jgi:hypothetical protein
MRAYKLLRTRADGSIGPLFINQRQRIPLGTWLEAEDHPTKGYAHRPGWHTMHRPVAPHLTEKGRHWYHVEIEDFERHRRPASQGGLWYLSKRMRVLRPVGDRLNDMD